jgi:hypothetical protein
MNNFRPIASLDCFRLTASLHARQSLMKDRPCLLRAGKDWTKACDEKWQALRNLIGQIERLPSSEGYESGDVYLLSVPPSEATDWEKHQTLAQPSDPMAQIQWQTLHLPIITNPGVHVHSGPEVTHIPFWLLTWVNSVPLGCVVNHGDRMACHLVIEFRPTGGAAQ